MSELMAIMAGGFCVLWLIKGIFDIIEMFMK